MYLSGVFINFNLPSADLLKEKKKKIRAGAETTREHGALSGRGGSAGIASF